GWCLHHSGRKKSGGWHARRASSAAKRKQGTRRYRLVTRVGASSVTPASEATCSARFRIRCSVEGAGPGGCSIGSGPTGRGPWAWGMSTRLDEGGPHFPHPFDWKLPITLL